MHSREISLHALLVNYTNFIFDCMYIRVAFMNYALHVNYIFDCMYNLSHVYYITYERVYLHPL